jgi:hypothetical protein
MINVPVESVFKPDGRQPRAYFSGYGRVKVYRDNIIVID